MASSKSGMLRSMAENSVVAFEASDEENTPTQHKSKSVCGKLASLTEDIVDDDGLDVIELC